ncbi:MAG: NAD(P)/FAD-dependent oxidoreductase [Candidatus Roizmanbacteria bacterium]|nr:NAD(P)/FAD-dependent oxidoreductase [Candidatus Roizmanbacteria bacterium]
MNDENYDVMVIGSGDAGRTVAFDAAKKGKKVAVVDKHSWGDTDGFRGDIPKSMLVVGAELADHVRRMNDVGVHLGSGQVSWKELQEWKSTYLESVSKDLKKRFQAAGIDTYQGAARFIDETSLSVNEEVFHAKTIHIASGSKPSPLGIQGSEFLLPSDEFLSLVQLPKRIIFIGGGYISFELAHIAARAGSEVMILQGNTALLKEFDSDLVDLLVKASEKIGIIVNKNRPLVKVEKHGLSSVVFTQQEGREIRENADLVVHAAGRVPDIEDMDLMKGNVQYSKNGISVTKYLQSVSNPRVTAAGDAADTGPLLTPVVVREGEIAAYNVLHKTKQRIPDYTFVPSVVCTIPPLAKAGYTEDEARAKGLDFDVLYQKTNQWFHSILVNEKFSAYKLLVQKKSGKILGAHVLGWQADAMINFFAFVMQHKMTIEDIKKPLYACPTAPGRVEHMVE